ncbi:PAS domain S-box protein [Nocardioides flavescens]|uniref:PAS domain S-box protein n=1 Tax=Nocardioides flavescens TaxID=2691959 RepID=UPI00136C0790
MSTGPTSGDVRAPSWRTLLLLLVGVYVAGRGAVFFKPDGFPITTFWPATAFCVATFALSPARRWPALAPAVFVVSVLASVTGGRAWDLSIGFGVTNTVEAGVAALLLTSAGRRAARLASQEDFLRLLATALVAAAVLSLSAASVVRLLGAGDFSATVESTFASHVAALMTLLPLLLVLGDEPRPPRRGVELAAQVSVLVATTVLVFAFQQTAPIAIAPVVALSWAALRLGLPVLTAELGIFAVVASLLTAHGQGPFATALAGSDLRPLLAAALGQGFLACAALLVLPLCIAAERNAALVERITSDSLLFRRNFTESLVGMAFVEPAASGRELVVVELNDTAAGVLGGTEDDLVGRRLGDLVELGPDYHAALPRLLRGTQHGWRTEAPLRPPREGRVDLLLSPLSEPGSTPFFAVQLLDVTTAYTARRALEVAQKLTNATLDTTNCIILVTDLEGVVVRVNAATEQITGYTEAELLGRQVWDTGIAPPEARDLRALLDWLDDSDRTASHEADAVTRSGQALRIVWNSDVVRDELGRPSYAVMTGMDVTDERTTTGLVDHLMEASQSTAIIGIDTAGRISVVNSGTAHLLGYEREELVGVPFHRLLKPTELLERTGAESVEDAFDILVRGLGRDGETQARDWTWLTRTAGEQLVSMTLSVAQDSLTARTGYLCVARDVTEQRHSQEVLIAALDKERDAVDRLRSLDQAKNEFVSTVSHELRTPVTSIVGYTEMLRDGSIVEPLPDQVPLLDSIGRNGQRLIAMINDLLMLSGLDARTVHWRHDPVDLAATLTSVEDAVRPLVGRRRLALDVRRPADAVPVLGDRAQLERVMVNLLSNAVKFTEDGGTVTLEMGVEAGEAVVRVRDTGIGIPVAEQGALFERFFRSTTAQSRQIQGTGLGLSIVSAIVSAHGGSIEVESAHLEGSVFTVRLPLADLGPSRSAGSRVVEPAG